SVVHVPVFTLVACTVGSLSGLYCQRMNRFDRKVAEYVPHLTSLDILIDKLSHGPIEMLGAKRTLIIAEFDQRDLGSRLAQGGSPIDADNRLLFNFNRLCQDESGNGNE